MIRRLLARINARFQAWLDYQLVVDAPAGDLGSLDVHNGMGECPPMTDAQVERLWRDIMRGPFTDWNDYQDNTLAATEDDIEDGPR